MNNIMLYINYHVLIQDLCVGRLTRQASLLEQTLFTRPEHLCLPPPFSGVRVTRSFVLSPNLM